MNEILEFLGNIIYVMWSVAWILFHSSMSWLGASSKVNNLINDYFIAGVITFSALIWISWNLKGLLRNISHKLIFKY